MSEWVFFYIRGDLFLNYGDFVRWFCSKHICVSKFVGLCAIMMAQKISFKIILLKTSKWRYSYFAPTHSLYSFLWSYQVERSGKNIEWRRASEWVRVTRREKQKVKLQDFSSFIFSPFTWYNFSSTSPITFLLKE